MRLKALACLLIMSFYQMSVPAATALSSTVVIRTVQPYSLTLSNGVLVKSASQELVEIENISSETMNMTGWSLKYQSASGTTLQNLKTILPSSGMQYTLLPIHSRDTFTSTDYATAHSLVSGLTFGLSLADSAGNVILVNALGQEVDRVGWKSGSTVNSRAEADPITLTSDTSTMQRTGFDTDNNARDFRVLSASTDPGYMFGGLYDAVDVCNNIVGIQEITPEGRTAYDDGTCASNDRCTNIDGVQLEIPEFYDRLAGGECIERDVCVNVDGMQHQLPEIYEFENGLCVPKFVSKQVLITELLANPDGSDTGHEYIELYNGSDETVNLADYLMVMSGKTHHFPAGKLLLSHTFVTFSDEDMDVVFPNTSGLEIQIVGRDGQITSVMPSYASAPTNQSWATINGSWQYTNSVTRGAENKGSLVDYQDDENTEDTVYAPCAANQYRSLETNRCRLITTSGLALTPCREGQYRSEETNRCRSIVQTVAASLKPCGDDQFRNPDSGRCKKIASTDDFVQPCDAGWERNITTNRCRKIKATSMPVAAFPVENIAPSSQSLSTWAIAAAVLLGALGYGLWEWRYEVKSFIRRIIRR